MGSEEAPLGLSTHSFYGSVLGFAKAVGIPGIGVIETLKVAIYNSIKHHLNRLSFELSFKVATSRTLIVHARLHVSPPLMVQNHHLSIPFR